jgi:dolichol-phosphate mannosyltransferase
VTHGLGEAGLAAEIAHDGLGRASRTSGGKRIVRLFARMRLGIGGHTARQIQPDGVELRHWAIGIVLFSVLLRALFIAHIELLPEEAYYWNYSRHIDIGYLDHPPMVAWLIRAGTLIAGDTAWGVRLGSLCCGLIAAAFCYTITRNLYGEKAALIALIFVQTLPFFFMSGLLMTPDSPLAAAWAAFFYYLERVLAGRSLAWIGVGCALGLGLLSKYTIGLAALAAFGYVIATKDLRFWLRRVGPYLAAVLALALFLPVVVWNYQHGWSSFTFQTVRRLAEPSRFSWFNLIGSAVVLIGPTGFLTAIALASGKVDREGVSSDEVRMTRQRRLAFWLVGLPLGVFSVFSINHQIKLNWIGPCWVAAIPLMSHAMLAWRRGAGRYRAWLAAAWPATTGIFLTIYMVGFSYLAFGLPGIGYSVHMELAPVGWRELAQQVGEIAHKIETDSGRDLLIVGMDRYETASELAFYLRNPLNAITATSAGHLFGGVGLMYEQWFPAYRTVAPQLLLVGWNRRDLSDERLAPYVDRLGPLLSGSIERNGHFIRQYFYRVGYGYPKENTHPLASH